MCYTVTASNNNIWYSWARTYTYLDKTIEAVNINKNCSINFLCNTCHRNARAHRTKTWRTSTSWKQGKKLILNIRLVKLTRNQIGISRYNILLCSVTGWDSCRRWWCLLCWQCAVAFEFHMSFVSNTENNMLESSYASDRYVSISMTFVSLFPICTPLYNTYSLLMDSKIIQISSTFQFVYVFLRWRPDDASQKNVSNSSHMLFIHAIP